MKDGRIEELVQQHHTDRVKMHELHEKASSFDTEMASVKSALSHEQAHRQRLEARLRSLMSTPDFVAEGLSGMCITMSSCVACMSWRSTCTQFCDVTDHINPFKFGHDLFLPPDRSNCTIDSDSNSDLGMSGGASSGFLSARGHSSSGTLKSGNFNGSFQQQQGGPGQGAASNYHPGSGDVWEEDGQDDLSHSVGGHTYQSNGGHSAASHYSSATQAYGAGAGAGSGNGGGGPRIAYHNTDTFGSSSGSGGNGAGDALGYSAGGGNHHNTGMRAQSPFANAARGYRGGGGDEYSATPSQQHQQRSSRASGSVYQQERDRFGDSSMRSPQVNQGSLTPTKETQRREYLSPRASDRNGEGTSSSSRHAQSPVVDRVSAALAARAAAESSKNALRLAQQQRNHAQASRHPSGASAVVTSPPRAATNHVNVASHSSSAEGGPNDSVSLSAAESIRRTQEMLSRRALNTVDAGSSNNSAAVNAGRERTPNSARGVSKLTESIQQANNMYPPSPQHGRADAR